jgi:hypothetical protein
MNENKLQEIEERLSDRGWLDKTTALQLIDEIRQLRKRKDEAIGEAGQLWTKILRAKEALK